VAYNDLIELARLCLRQADNARTLATANQLRRMGEEYQARADALLKGQRPDAPVGTLSPSAPDTPQRAAQQQQQPQEESTAPSEPKRP
jgi:hypothetical protein